MKMYQSEDAIERIRQKIVSMEWAPGTRLSSNQIAAELGMSRTPVEKALANLERYGLVRIESGKYVVSSFSMQDIVELYQVKEAIECQAIKIILERGGLDAGQLQALRDTVERHSVAGRPRTTTPFSKRGWAFTI